LLRLGLVTPGQAGREQGDGGRAARREEFDHGSTVVKFVGGKLGPYRNVRRNDGLSQ
jgi:hypothetical protein